MKLPAIFHLALAAALLAPLAAQADTHPAALEAALQATPKSSCQPRALAETEAESLALKSAQTYCRGEGFGWRAAKVTALGSLDCHSCGGGQVSCGYAGLSLQCRKSAPKLVLLGWLPGRP